MAFLTWGSYSIFDAGALLNQFFMTDSYACYGTNAEIDQMLTQANASTNPEKTKNAVFQGAETYFGRGILGAHLLGGGVVCNA